MKLRKRKNLKWIFIWLSSLFIESRKVNERYITHATEIFHDTDTELKLNAIGELKLSPIRRIRRV